MKIEQAKPDVNVRTLNDDELLLLHGEMHSYHRDYDVMDREVEGWTREDVIEVHKRIVDEIRRRDLPHQKLGQLDGVGSVMEPKLELRTPPVRQQILDALDEKFLTKADLRQKIDDPDEMIETKLDDLLQSGEVAYAGMDHYKTVPDPVTPEKPSSEPSLSVEMSDLLDLGEWA